MRRLSVVSGAFVLLAVSTSQLHAGGSQATIEVRLEARTSGTPFSFTDGTTRQLERWTVLRTGDFTRATARPTRNPNLPGLFEVEAELTPEGRRAFVDVGEQDRARSYCVIIGRTIDSCAAFPPSQKAIFDRSHALMERSGPEARKLAAGLNARIAALASDRLADARASREGPRALLDHLYRRSIANRQPNWFEGEEREEFLSRDLVALWRKCDAAERAGNEDALLDFDPIAATNGLTLKTHRVRMEAADARRAKAAVTVGYVEKSPSQVVRYDLVREGGGWRIADIKESDFSLSQALTEFAAAPIAKPVNGR